MRFAEGVLERSIDLARGDAEAGCRVPVDDKIGIEPATLLVGYWIENFRDVFQCLGQTMRPDAKLGDIVALQRILVLAAVRLGVEREVGEVSKREEGKRGANASIFTWRSFGRECRGHPRTMAYGFPTKAAPWTTVRSTTLSGGARAQRSDLA